LSAEEICRFGILQNYSLSMGRELEKNSAEFKNLLSSLKVTLSSSITINSTM
ncbi:Bifunctional glutamine synthetase adenylyltransferase/adenylyl-removing enzyme, partial [Clarias magur]